MTRQKSFEIPTNIITDAKTVREKIQKYLDDEVYHQLFSSPQTWKLKSQHSDAESVVINSLEIHGIKATEESLRASIRNALQKAGFRSVGIIHTSTDEKTIIGASGKVITTTYPIATVILPAEMKDAITRICKLSAQGKSRG